MVLGFRVWGLGFVFGFWDLFGLGENLEFRFYTVTHTVTHTVILSPMRFYEFYTPKTNP